MKIITYAYILMSLSEISNIINHINHYKNITKKADTSILNDYFRCLKKS